MANRDDQLVLWLVLSSVLVVMATLTESFKGKDIRSERKGRVKHKYTGSSMEEDYEKSINDMVMQLQNNSALSGSKCEIDLQLWMSNRRSLSPWSYRVNRDETRIPTDIPEAHCLCSGCINPFTMQEDRTMTSVPIYTKIPVKRQFCDGPKQRRRKKKCNRKYRTAMENIAIGCTCIF
ncbi:interleukin-17B-like isoform X1 [Huso huso]|uniref:Interleukin-17B-like isoform X1 n=1 Tax=Huso huso TaxID=61971 RepID=A0ABR0YQL8_HUSHU